MYHFTFPIAVGPFLIMALASVAMFMLSNTVARTRHAWLWALSFAIYTFVWALVASFRASPPNLFQIFLLDLAMVAALFCYFAAFLQRQHRLMVPRLAAAAGLVFMVEILLSIAWQRDTPIFWAPFFLSGVRMILFAIAASLVTPGDRPASATERSVIGMLLIIAFADLGLMVILGAQYLGHLKPATYFYAAAILGTPISAAMGLFTLMLIASDFSRERLRLIHTDPLTEVLNRLGFEQNAKRLIARARPPRRPVAMILADIDRFKGINDRFGHLAGDAALISFARCLVDSVSPSALVGRFGGEEFALLLDGHGATAGAAYAEVIRTQMAGLSIPGGADIAMTASFGVAELLPGGALHDLYARADAALYLSKQEGRNRTSVDPGRAG